MVLSRKTHYHIMGRTRDLSAEVPRKRTHNLTCLSPKWYAEAQPEHALFAKCVLSYDVIGSEPIAISGTNSKLRANTEHKNPNITFIRDSNPGPQSAAVPRI
ncbi:hypothetical protein O3G_MSEX014551 [Manduca sexta]|uniref:Uncharacterized protein n=1 Tax=Manduca sexta TaxID=7130 RepID=A0A921ZU08_MANSE|nr:hypothetical protein O3G_MSEX014551 [Manduca sexta]KAG6464490.1 hypothetical protein O3G_MSEX014551 [Manduca sexta]